MITSLIPSFNSGELSPLIHLRSDIEKYRSGCRTLQNFLIVPYGGVKRRAGFAYVATATTVCRLFRFQVSAEIGFILEFGEEYIRFYRNSAPVQAGGGDYQIATPYKVDDLAEIQAVQINNIAYFTHPNHPVQRLLRLKDNSWVLAPVDFTYPAMMDENLKASRKFTTSTAGQPSEVIVVNSNFDVFSEAHLGAHFQISHKRAANQFTTTISATSGNDGQASDYLRVQGAWTFTTSGIFDGRFILERSDDDGDTWDDFRIVKSNKDANFSLGGFEEKLVLMRIRYHHSENGTNGGAKLEASSGFLRGLVKVIEVVNERRVRVEVIEVVQAGTTSYWREGAWSARRGYPRTVCAHEQRIIYGGTEDQPQTVWASVVDDYENFRPGGTNDDDSWSHVFASDQQNFIQWMISQKSLLIGTSGDEWVMSASREEAIITPTTVRARRHSGCGSAFMKARMIDDSVIFVQRGGTKVRDLNYSLQTDGYVTSDLTLLAEHITGEGVIETAFQTMPFSRLWCVTRNGELIVLTYDRGQSLTGWQRITTGKGTDGFESVAIKSTSGELDQVWVSVRRTINGTTRRYVERMNDDGAFLETPWSLLYADTTGMPIWDAGYTDYAVLDVVSHPLAAPGALFLCKLAYNTSTNEDPPFINATNWEIAHNWDTDVTETWFVGMPVYRAGKWYRCIQDALRSVPEQNPGDDAGEYWVVVTEFSDAPEFKAANEYEANDVVSKDFKPYKALSDHSAWNITPGVDGAYWALEQGFYGVGQLVSYQKKNYRCKTAHTPSAASQPGVGASWSTYWEVVTTTEHRFYVDSGVLRNNTGTITELAGLGHLEGETVQILADGFTLPERVVTGGKILFDQDSDPTSFTSLSVGLKYESVLEPMALEAGMQNGTSVSRKKRIHELAIYFHESGACKVAAKKSDDFETIPFRDADFAGDTAQPLFTGAIEHSLDARHDPDASFVLKQDLPMPLTVLAVVPKWNIYGDQG